METYRDALWIIHDRGMSEFRTILDLKPEFVHYQSEQISSKTLLHWACFHSNLEAVGVLLERGAQVNIQDDSGYTPLHYAVTETLDPFLIDCLMSAGADPEIADYGGCTPLMTVSARRFDLALLCAERLIQWGARIDLQSAIILKDIEFIKKMVESHPLGIQQATHPNDLLYFAVERQDLETIAYLIEKGADVTSPTLSGKPPLFHALGKHASAEVVRLLLDAGADPNAESPYGDRLLTFAENSLTSDVIIQVLREYGAQE